MDLLKLNSSGSGLNPYGVVDLIENWESLIWTERYADAGDFELKTRYVKETLDLLPEMTLISLLDTTETMMVETHSIEKNEDGIPELTIKGRSIDAFAEERWIEAPYQKVYKMPAKYTVAEMATVLLWNAFVNPTEQDVTHSIDWFRFATDTLPNVAVSDSTTLAGFSGNRFLEGGQLYPQLLKVLHWNRLGVRGVRPTAANPSSRVISVGTGGGGVLTKTTRTTPDELRFDVYNGRDLQHGVASQASEVIFHHAVGDLEDQKYLFSVRGMKTVASVAAQGFMNGGTKVKDPALPGDQGNSSIGWNRRALWVDGGTINDGDSINDYVEGLVDRGEAEIQANARTKMFDGKISNLSAYKYGVDYLLGDKVTVIGDYGITQPMRVVEYIRSVDPQTPEGGYPGLAVID
jgi:hypothetical protein